MHAEPAPGTLYIVSAPSGAGKTSLVHGLVQLMADVVVSVSYTTRPPRPGERDGEAYHFVDEGTFLRMRDAGEFLEHARVFDHFYGTSAARVDAELAAGRDVVLEIDWQGARQVRAQRPDAIGVFVLPPSLDTLRERLRHRGQDSDEVVARRMQAAREEIAHFAEYHYVVVNDVFEQALADLAAIVRAGRLREPRQSRRHAALIAELLSAEHRNC